MAGRLISIVGKQSFSIVASTSGIFPTVILGNRVYDVRDAVSGVLVWRVFSSTLGTSGAFALNLVNSVVMPDDPGNIYVGSTVATLSSSASVSTPTLLLAGFVSTTPCGPMVAINLQNTGSTAVSSSIVMAVDLLIRDT